MPKSFDGVFARVAVEVNFSVVDRAFQVGVCVHPNDFDAQTFAEFDPLLFATVEFVRLEFRCVSEMPRKFAVASEFLFARRKSTLSFRVHFFRHFVIKF
ncbi:MAG: hypothetical protein IKN27_09645, partial [Selenomonadaceae bacterium]|nr:hypothetical protein [Selenomonadaceae bacterium]